MHRRDKNFLEMVQAHVGAQANVKSGGDLISANFFISTPETAGKNKSIDFHRKYELWQLRFLGKNVKKNNTRAR